MLRIDGDVAQEMGFAGHVEKLCVAMLLEMHLQAMLQMEHGKASLSEILSNFVWESHAVPVLINDVFHFAV